MHDNYLRLQLELLISNFGYDKVIDAIDKSKKTSRKSISNKIKANKFNSNSKKGFKKRSLSDILDDQQFKSDKQKELIVCIMTHYEMKSFLVSIKDVNHFLNTNGIKKEYKSRQTASRSVLKILLNSSELELSDLAKFQIYKDGESQLEVLANEIMT